MASPITPFAGITLDDFETKITVLGAELTDNLGRRRRLVQSQAPIVACDVIHINGQNLANSITFAIAKLAGQLGICPFSVSCSTSGQNFWAILSGPAPFRVGVSCQPSVPLYTTDTAGVVNNLTASLSQLQIMGLELDVGVSNSSVGNSALQGTAGNLLIRNPTNA